MSHDSILVKGLGGEELETIDRDLPKAVSCFYKMAIGYVELSQVILFTIAGILGI